MTSVFPSFRGFTTQRGTPRGPRGTFVKAASGERAHHFHPLLEEVLELSPTPTLTPVPAVQLPLPAQLQLQAPPPVQLPPPVSPLALTAAPAQLSPLASKELTPLQAKLLPPQMPPLPKVAQPLQEVAIAEMNVKQVVHVVVNMDLRRNVEMFKSVARRFVEITTSADGREEMIKFGGISALVSLLRSTNSSVRHIAEDALTNLADDGESQAARRIAEEIVVTLQQGATSLSYLEVVGLVDACHDLAAMSKDMVYNLAANDVHRTLIPLLAGGPGHVREKVLATLVHMGRKSSLAARMTAHQGAVYYLWKVILDPCWTSHLERGLACRLLLIVYGLPESWMGLGQEEREERATLVARNWLHKNNVSGAHIKNTHKHLLAVSAVTRARNSVVGPSA